MVYGTIPPIHRALGGGDGFGAVCGCGKRVHLRREHAPHRLVRSRRCGVHEGSQGSKGSENVHPR